MATVIRSPEKGEPRRIAASVQAEVQPAPVARGTETPFTYETESPSQQEFVGVAEQSGPVEANTLESVLEDYKRGSAAELLEANARAEIAERRLRGLETELDVLREDARRAGHEEGIKKGQEDAHAALVELAGSLKSMIASLESQRLTLLERNEDRLVEIVYAAVAKILGDALAGEAGVRQAVRQVLQHVSRRDPMLIRIAPQDHAFLTTLSTELVDAGATVELVMDERVELGGCILETTAGSLDGRLEVQLHNLKAALLSARARRRAEKDGAGG